MVSQWFTSLPSMSDLASQVRLRALADRVGQHALVRRMRAAWDEIQRELQTSVGERRLPDVSELAERVARQFVSTEPLPLRVVINATGRLDDPALGGVPWAEEAVAEAVSAMHDFTTPLDPTKGDPTAAELARLAGAEAACVFHEGIGAVLMTLAGLASPGTLLVARGSWGDAGDDGRLDTLAQLAQTTLVEVGTINRTTLDDVAAAIEERTRLLWWSEPEQFAIVGSRVAPSLEELVALGRRRSLSVVVDLPRGALLSGLSTTETLTAQEALRRGADLVVVRGGGQLGGPPVGLVLGRRALVERIERLPWLAALRLDKASRAALGATVRLHREPSVARQTIPLWQLVDTAKENLQHRAERIAAVLGTLPEFTASTVESPGVATVAPAVRRAATWCVALEHRAWDVATLAARLQSATPSVMGRLDEGRLLLDLASVFPRQDAGIVEACESLSSATEHEALVASSSSVGGREPESGQGFMLNP